MKKLIEYLQANVTNDIWLAAINHAVETAREKELVEELQYQYIQQPEVMEQIINAEGVRLLKELI